MFSIIPSLDDILGSDEDDGMDKQMEDIKNHQKTVSSNFSPFCSVSSAFSGMFNGDPNKKGMLEGLESTLGSVTKAMSECWNTLSGWYTSFKNWVSAKIASLFNSGNSPEETSNIAILLGKAKSWGKSIMSGLKSAYEWVATKVSDITASMGKAITGAFGALTLSGCDDLKEGMASQPPELQSKEQKAALQSTGKTKEQIFSDYLMDDDALAKAEEFAMEQEILYRRLQNVPEVSDEAIIKHPYSGG